MLLYPGSGSFCPKLAGLARIGGLAASYIEFSRTSCRLVPVKRGLINPQGGTMKFALSPLVFSAALYLGPAAAQQACPFNASSLDGGQVYYLDGATPTKLTNTSLLEGSQRKAIILYYVVRSAGGDRKGAVVVKSARLGVPLEDDSPPRDRVGLKRDEVSVTCDRQKVRRFSNSVTTHAYSEYHDYAQENGEYLDKYENGVQARTVLEQFHTIYETASGCRATNAVKRQDGRYEARSNRSQFSFDINTVDGGYSSAVYYIVANAADRARSFVLPSAFAAGPKLRERKVEIKHYQTSAGYACIPIRIEARGKDQVVRVNDLEASRMYWEAPEFRIGPMIGAAP
jgi:hypothetical protein